MKLKLFIVTCKNCERLSATSISIFCEFGRSMLRRFQLDGQTLEHEVVTDRLLLTY